MTSVQVTPGGEPTTTNISIHYRRQPHRPDISRLTTPTTEKSFRVVHLGVGVHVHVNDALAAEQLATAFSVCARELAAIEAES